MQNSIKIVILFLFFTSGVCGLIYEVVWIRMFGLVLGNTTYAISITLGSFFAGLALGGFYFGRYVDGITVGNWQLAVGSKQESDSAVGANLHVHTFSGTNPNGTTGFQLVKAEEERNIVRIYAFLEFGVSASALFVGIGISYMQELFIRVGQYIDYSSIIIDLMRFLISFSLLLIPATLMGATLPVLSKFIIRQYHEVRSSVGLLYGVNTFGAALGCLITGFYLIQTFGVNATVYTAVIINFVIGIFVLILERVEFFSATDDIRQKTVGNWQLAKDKRQKSDDRKEMTGSSIHDQVCNVEETYQTHATPLPRSTIHIVLFLFGLSGFTSIAYEIIWARILSSLFLNSIYSFTTMLATFLCGLAIGSIVVLRLFRRKIYALALLGIVEFCIGISVILLILLFDLLPEASLRLSSLNQTGGLFTWNMNVCIEFTLSFMVMIVPCILIGMTLPLVSQIVTNDLRLLGKSVGRAYSINTIGGILGATIGGCLLIPWAGVKFSELSMAGLNVCIGIAFLLCANKNRHKGEAQGLPLKKIVIPLFCAFAIAIGIFCSFADIRMWDTHGELLYYEEDAAATVSVLKERDGNKKLIVNKKYSLGTSRATPLQKRMGYIPLLLHSNPHDVLVVGMGTGITLSAVASYELTENVKCVEVISSVVEAAKQFFSKENNTIYQNKKIDIIIEDGRNYLLINKGKYDVIISDLFVPYHAGAGSLYSKEHFELCKDRLYDIGLFCQWLPLYQMSTREFKVICKTFSTVFPFTTLWFCTFERGLICGLVGTKHKLKIDPSSLKKNIENANTKNKLKEAILGGPEELLSLFITDEIGLKSFTDGYRVNTDNYPIIEFLAPKNIYEFLEKRVSVRQAAPARKKSFQLIHESGWKSGLRTLYGKAEERHLGISNLSVVRGIRKDILPLLSYNKEYFDIKNMKYYSEAAGHLISGILYFYNDELVKAEDEYLTAWELAPDHLYLRKMFQDLSVRFYRMDNYDETIFINEKLVDTNPEIIDPFLFFYLGLAYQAKGYIDKAISSYHNAIALNPSNAASIHYNLGIIYKSQGLMEKASLEFKEAKRLAEITN